MKSFKDSMALFAFFLKEPISSSAIWHNFIKKKSLLWRRNKSSKHKYIPSVHREKEIHLKYFGSNILFKNIRKKKIFIKYFE
jgi:hypothetical protein